MVKLSIRIDLAGEGRLGPGKIQLLEALAAHGSISAAGRAMRMSYKRAWDLVAELNGMFDSALVEARPGGASGGGATLTALGRQVIDCYRAIEAAARAAASQPLEALEARRKQS